MLFNCLSAKNRNLTKAGLDDSKMALNKWLEMVPDQPEIDCLMPGTHYLSDVYFNSIIYQTKRGQGSGLLLIGQSFIVPSCISPALGPTPGPVAGL